jgi:hypothetical protein
VYNLIVGMTDGVASSGRILEYTDDALKAQFSDASGPIPERMVGMPTLLMPEVQNHGKAPAVARVGRLTGVRRSGRDFQFNFMPHPLVPTIPLERVPELADQLGVESEWEWNRTHWAVKDRDLFEVALEVSAAAKLEPTAFTFPTHQPRERDLVAVMMPFGGFDDVYAAIKSAAEDAGVRCLRADDIWVHEHVMDEVIGLIWRAHVVVSDFTNRNANVFYETGIAHSLGRPVVPVTQTMADIPFDLQSIRALQYLPNGLTGLRKNLAARLEVFKRDL